MLDFALTNYIHKKRFIMGKSGARWRRWIGKMYKSFSKPAGNWKIFLNELKENTFNKYQCMTVGSAGVSYEELDEFIGDNGYFSMIFDFRYDRIWDIASGSEWFKRIDWNIKELNEKVMASQLAIQKYGWGANLLKTMISLELQQNIYVIMLPMTEQLKLWLQ